MAQTLHDYSTAENVNKHCSQGVRDFADSLVFISDYRFEYVFITQPIVREFILFKILKGCMRSSH